MRQIVIFAALRMEIADLRKRLRLLREAKIAGLRIYRGNFRGVEVILVLTGVGRGRSRLAANRILAEIQPWAIINLGTAGALSADLQTGQALLPEAICSEEGAEVRLANIDLDGSDGVRRGRLLTVKRGVNGSRMRGELRAKYRVDAVDMEACEIAQIAEEQGMAFYCLKVISDDAGGCARLTYFWNLLKARRIIGECGEKLLETLTTGIKTGEDKIGSSLFCMGND